MGPTRIDPLDHARAIVLHCLLKDAHVVTDRQAARTFTAALRAAQRRLEHDSHTSAGRVPREPAGWASGTLAVAAYAILILVLASWLVGFS